MLDNLIKDVSGVFGMNSGSGGRRKRTTRSTRRKGRAAVVTVAAVKRAVTSALKTARKRVSVRGRSRSTTRSRRARY